MILEVIILLCAILCVNENYKGVVIVIINAKAEGKDVACWWVRQHDEAFSHAFLSISSSSSSSSSGMLKKYGTKHPSYTIYYILVNKYHHPPSLYIMILKFYWLINSLCSFLHKVWKLISFELTFVCLVHYPLRLTITRVLN